MDSVRWSPCGNFLATYGAIEGVRLVEYSSGNIIFRQDSEKEGKHVNKRSYLTPTHVCIEPISSLTFL